ncbi:MAG: hypothetical protein WC683_10005 [bacterium]
MSIEGELFDAQRHALEADVVKAARILLEEMGADGATLPRGDIEVVIRRKRVAGAENPRP